MDNKLKNGYLLLQDLYPLISHYPIPPIPLFPLYPYFPIPYPPTPLYPYPIPISLNLISNKCLYIP